MNQKLLDKSISIAKHLTFASKFRVAAFLYERNKLISVGQNNMESTDPKVLRLARRFNIDKFKRYNFPHAELDVISRVWGRYYITGRESLVVVRLSRKNEPMLAKPCSNCQRLIDALNITKVYWTGE